MARRPRWRDYEVRADGKRATYRILFAREGRRGQVFLALETLEATARWAELGFRGGSVALFRSPDFPLPPPPDPSDIPPDAVLVGSSVWLFGDA